MYGLGSRNIIREIEYCKKKKERGKVEEITLNNGIKMPLIGFGTYEIRGDEGIQLMEEAILTGYRMFDTAHMYENEEEVGLAIKRSGISREDFFITTKLNQPFNSYEKAKQGIELSLKKMDLEYIDLYLIHEPYVNGLDMYRALTEYYHKGIIRAIGISNYSRRKYDAFVKLCGMAPAVNQIESHVYYSQLEFIEHMRKNGVMAQAWAPLAGGNRNVGNEMILCDIGQKYGKSPYQVALRYLIQNGISVIPKSHNINRIRSNFEVFDFSLNDQDMDQIKLLDQKETLYSWMKVWE